jgi:CO dehydrogenase maturation factor
MKLAISGKGGVGKTLIAAMLSRALADNGCFVTAIDADPDANLALALGFPDSDQIVPVAAMEKLIQERTETVPGQSGLYFKINPNVDDIPDKYSVKHGNIRLLVMGKPKAGGAGCYCPENAVLSALVAHLLLAPNEVVIMDMAAGIEHLSRGTAKSVDRLIIVVEPGRASLDTADRIKKLANDLGIVNISIIGNKIHNQTEKDFIVKTLSNYNILGFVPYDEILTAREIEGTSRLNASHKITAAIQEITEQLIKSNLKNPI